MIYFDSAASSFYKPRSVIKAVTEALSVFPANAGRSGHKYSLMAAEKIFECRCILAQMFKCEPEQVIFCLNATMALNIAIKGAYELALKNNKPKIIISDLEHNSVLRPVAKYNNYTVFKTDLNDDNSTLQNFKNALSDDVGVCVCTHASNVLGKILPVDEISDICEKKGIHFILDASQTAGCYDFSFGNCFAMCFSGHKGLLAPQGVGVMILKEGAYMPTLLEGGTGSETFRLENPQNYPERYESGTLCTPAICGLYAGCKHIMKIGTNYIHQYENHLLKTLYNMLKNTKDIILYTPCPNDSYTGVLAFNKSSLPSDDVADILNQNNIMVRAGYHCSPLCHNKIGTKENGCVRVSFCMENSSVDLEKLIKVIKNI